MKCRTHAADTTLIFSRQNAVFTAARSRDATSKIALLELENTNNNKQKDEQRHFYLTQLKQF